MKSCLAIFAFVLTVAAIPAFGAAKPNIVIILTDDQGYADISFNPQHPPEVSTPNMDALAREGIFFDQAYLSGNVCSPTRAGLMLGRYQQRVGVYTAGEGGSGFDPKLPIFPSFLPKEYVSTAIGKWHLGLDDDYPELKWHALSRGFDECYKFMGRGAHDYYKLSDPGRPMYRNMEEINDSGYLTTRLTEEAVDFIRNHKNGPFFLYLAYNAVHAPKQAPQADIELYDTGNPDRDILMAMLMHLDKGVGSVIATLKEAGVWDNTLLFFLTDNGGSKAMHAVNTPLRAWKQWNYEGGIRTPFIVSWPARFSGAREIHTPVISLDILPTVLDAAGIRVSADHSFDGKSILPVLDGKKDLLHENLYWSEGGATGEWAVRSGDWKLVVHKAKIELFDLGTDVGEHTDLSGKHPEIVERLKALYDKWLDEMAEPKHGPGKR